MLTKEKTQISSIRSSFSLGRRTGLFEAELGCEKARKRLSEGFVPKRGLSGFELESMRWSTGSRRERAAVLCTAMRVR